MYVQSDKPIEIKPAEGLLSPMPMDRTGPVRPVAVEATERVQPTLFYVDPHFPSEFRTANLAVNWEKLSAEMINVNLCSMDTYLLIKRGNLDPANDKFATDLINAGKMLYNSGISMINAGDQMKTMIAQYGTPPTTTAPPSTIPVAHPVVTSASGPQVSVASAGVSTGGTVTVSAASTAISTPITTVASGGARPKTVQVATAPTTSGPSTSTSVAHARVPFTPGTKKMASKSKLPRPKPSVAESSAATVSTGSSEAPPSEYPGPKAKVRSSTEQRATMQSAAYPPDFTDCGSAHYACTMCPQSFTKHTDLILHLQLHQRYITCTLCGVPFANKQQLMSHVRRLHDVANRHFCSWPDCFASYSDKYNLQRHEAKHTMQQKEGPKPYQCPYCETKLSSDNSLRKHISTVHREQHAKAQGKKK